MGKNNMIDQQDILHKRFRAMIENSKDGIALTDADRIITYISPAVRDVLGYEPEELIGKRSYDVLIEPDQVSENIAFRDSIAPGQTLSRQSRVRHRDGTWRWIEAEVTNHLENPAVLGMLTNFRDITDRMAAQEALADSERRFRALIENNKDGIVLTDRDRHFIYASPSITGILGYTPAELMSTRPVDLYHPDDMEEFARGIQDFIAGNIGPVSVVMRLRHKDGDWRWLEVTASNRLSDPAIGAIVTNFRDVTEQKNAQEVILTNERKYRALIEYGKDGIALTGPDRLFTYLSPQIKTIMGYEPEDLIGTHPLEMYHPDDHAAIFSFVENIKDMNVPHTISNLRIRRSDGSWMWAELTFCDQLADPAVGAMVCNFRDVTERKQAEDALAQLNQSLERKVQDRTAQLQESNKALESFSYMAAHDLQAPLRVLSGYATILQKDHKPQLNADGAKLLDTIVLKTRHMSRLISDMLTFSRACHAVMNIEQVDFDQVVRDAIEQLTQVAATTATPPLITVHHLGSCACDAGLIEQVWLNLISNALKYSGKKEQPEIEIGSDVVDGEAIYYVRDNGAGFDMKHAESLFEVFKRLHSAVEFEGTGIGLALVKSIIIRHNGRVWATAERDEGATFFFTLPCR